MTDKAKDVYVQLFLYPDRNPPFELKSKDLPMSTTQGSNSELIFRNKGHNGFRVHFQLQEPTHGYLFPANRAQAVWSQLGEDACPESEIWDVFRALNVSDDRKTLTVRNGNVHKEELGKFSYTLRVVRDSDNDWLPLDPGGDNQNGGTDRFEWSATMACTASGAVAAIGAATLIGNSLEPASPLLYGIGGGVIGLVIGLVADRFF